MDIGRIPLMTILPPDPTGAEVLRQSIAIVLYAEARAMLLGWASAPPWDPVVSCWSTLRRVLSERLRPGTPDFLVRAQEILQQESTLALAPVVRRAGPPPFDATVGRGQIGSLQGVDEMFHEVGFVAMFHRSEDPRVLSVAIRLADFARRYSPGGPPS